MLAAKSKTGKPRLSDLTEVRQGKGWHIGELEEAHPVFNYLKKGALIGEFANVRTMFEAFRVLEWKPAQGMQSDNPKDGQFHTFNSLNEALDVFENNPKSIRQFKAEELQLKSDESIGREITFDVTGDYLDIGRFLEDQPECFGVNYQGNPTGLHVTLYADAAAVAHVDKAAISYKQGRMLRLVDWMEQQGVRCRITVVESTEIGHAEIVVKDYGDAINLNDIAITMHPDFLRRVMFLFDEQSKLWNSWYGMATHWSGTMRNRYVADPEDGLTVFISSQSTSNIPQIDKQFDRLRDKIATLISGEKHDEVAGEDTIQRDFTKVYAVQI